MTSGGSSTGATRNLEISFSFILEGNIFHGFLYFVAFSISMLLGYLDRSINWVTGIVVDIFRCR